MLRRLFAVLVISVQALSLTTPLLAQEAGIKKETPTTENASAQNGNEDNDADLPKIGKKLIGKERYMQLRNEQLSFWRGLPYPREDVRNQAIFQMMRQENRLRAATGEPDAAPNALWRPLGPAPIPNGQTVGRTDPVSGRVSSIAVHPTNPNIVYVGTAQGGLYRTLDGGATWTPLLDNALTLAIGSVAISPSDPSIVYVGTGEAAFSLDGFFGVGIYRITNADTNPVVAGPLNRDAANADVFTGRSVSKIVVHPTNPNIIFATTSNGVGGLGGNAPAVAPARGLYRATNALAANPTFEKLNVVPANPNLAMIDVVMEPGNPNRLISTVTDTFNTGLSGIYVTENALDPAPTFTRTLTTGNGANEGRTELAVNKVGATTTVIAAAGFQGGTVHRSNDGGATWTLTVDNNFCTPQCFYDIAVAIDPNDATKVYLGGAPALPFGRSSDGGTTFANSSTGLHVDTHSIVVAPSNTNIIYFGSDGGVWKSIDAGANWTSLNNSNFSATQFQSLALHPLDRNYMIGGTQDNGTNFLEPNGITWLNSDGGDGGFTVIDQNSPNTTDVTAYHTYFNATNNFIGFARATSTVGNGDPNWDVFLGCGFGIANGINCADPVLFYAPLVRGPGNPNTLYMGTNKLYRSADKGTTMPAVSQALTAVVNGQTVATRISAIGISPQNDNVRIVGTELGTIFGTTTGATTLVDLDPNNVVPNRYVGRVTIDPTNSNTAYVALNGFGLAAGQHVYKTTNLNDPVPTWTIAGNGIPDVPVNAFAIDPANTQNLYAGTDIGVFRSTDAGASWQPFSDGLPRVAVFDMAIQPVHRVLRVATHGRGIWEISLNPTVRSRADFDGDGRTDISVFRSSDSTWYLQRSLAGSTAVRWGASGDIPVPGRYDADDKTDFAVFRPSESRWYVLSSETNTVTTRDWGASGDKPVVGDYTGDGRDDYALFRQANGTWYVLPSDGNAAIYYQFGQAGDVPVPGNYDADNKTDFAVFRNGVWFIQASAAGFSTVNWGLSSDKLVPADYDGDNRDDIAIYRDGQWWIRRSSTEQTQIVNFGLAGDVPVPGDYDGDGSDDVAVFRTGLWYVNGSTSGVTVTNFGLNGDTPVPSLFIP